MEIKLSAGDKFQIPENCKATIKDNVIIIEEQNEELKEGFKDGDILHSKTSNIVAIFKYYTSEAKVTFCSYYNTYSTCQLGWDNSYFRHATEEEKQAFFDDLKAKGLRWNAETKQMERIRKRAREDESYLYIETDGVVTEEEDEGTPFDDKNYNLGNYYLLEELEQAEEDAKAIKAIFEKRLKV